MLGSLEKLVAVLGTPLAVIYAIGSLAQVVNVWLVETAYDFRFLTAFHIVSILDRSVVIGLGLKYLLWTLPIAAIALFILPRFLRRLPASADRFALLRNLRQGVLSSSEGENQKSWLEQWIWLMCGSFIVSLFVMVCWLPLQAYLSVGEDPVLEYLPHAKIYVVAATPAVAIDGQALASQTAVSSSETQDERAVQPTVVEGVLLSHDEAYWYILSKSARLPLTTPALPSRYPLPASSPASAWPLPCDGSTPNLLQNYSVHVRLGYILRPNFVR